jgi:hypothetical protein
MTVTLTTSGQATERQASYIKALLIKHECSDAFVARVATALDDGTMDKIKASEVIDWLLKKPIRKASHDATIAAPVAEAVAIAGPTVSKVPAGHYAVPSATGNNDLDFFRVDVPETGKYAGRTFVKRIVGGHPEFNVPRSNVDLVLERIVAAGVDEAATKYGVEIGRCYVCNRTLTDDLSRSLGIGPHCRS